MGTTSVTDPAIPNQFWTYNAWTLYFLTFLEFAAFVFYYLGWMNNSVFTISPVALMVITIVQTGLYLGAFALYVFRVIPVELTISSNGFNLKRTQRSWMQMINYRSVAHCFIAFLGSAGGMVMAIVWYSKYNGTFGTPVYADGDVYIWFKMIFLWMTVVWLNDLTSLFKLFADIITLQKISITSALATAISATINRKN